MPSEFPDLVHKNGPFPTAPCGGGSLSKLDVGSEHCTDAQKICQNVFVCFGHIETPLGDVSQLGLQLSSMGHSKVQSVLLLRTIRGICNSIRNSLLTNKSTHVQSRLLPCPLGKKIEWRHELLQSAPGLRSIHPGMGKTQIPPQSEEAMQLATVAITHKLQCKSRSSPNSKTIPKKVIL